MGQRGGEATVKAIEKSLSLAETLLIYAEIIALLAFTFTLCLVVYMTFKNPTIPSVVQNRVLFGLLTFGLLVFLIRQFGDKLSNDTKAVVIGIIATAISAIIMFLYDKDKENKDNTEEEVDEQ